MTEPVARKLRTPEDVSRLRLALVPIDEAMWASEQKYGIGRLERIVSPATRESYKRGWDRYRLALDSNDAAEIEAIGPKLIAALAYMDQEATAAGHKPLAPDTWEAAMPDGSTLVVVRSGAEASAVIRAANAADGGSYETTIPPDIAITVRDQHEGRKLTVVTMAEVARLFALHGSVVRSGEGQAVGTAWGGTPTESGRQMEEMTAYDETRTGYPLPAPLAVGLGF